MSFSVDQFMQVQCKLQLTSDSESSESIHTNCEQVRLCASSELDKNSTLFVMVCSNETSNNHILAYYIERERAGCRAKPKIVVKQIYYHKYNEDIVALCLSETGSKLILISASSTIYILPIKNILLDLHAQQLRSSQGRSMYFYDATILNNLRSIDEPLDIVCWDSVVTPGKSYIVVACRDGNRLVFIDAGEKKELCSTSASEPIKSIEIIRDRFSHSLLITCDSYNQYRLTLELLNQDSDSDLGPSIISLPKASSAKSTSRQLGSIDDETVLNLRDFTPSWTSKPLPIKLNSSGGSAIHRVFTPASRFGSQTNLSTAALHEARDRPLSVMISQQPNLIGVIDILGANQMRTASQQPAVEPRLLRFYLNKHYFYRSQRPQAICKLNNLDPDEMITHLVLTERFIALATDSDRCIINSRNCCKLKNPSPHAPIDLSPLVKEVTFNNEEKILALIKSPVTHDQDNILDSFILVTTRSIYSIDARHNCRDLFINLIDSHLAIKRTLFTPRTRSKSFDDEGCTPVLVEQVNDAGCVSDRSRSAESNLLISDFLQHREVYESICHDSLAFSTLFKLELSSLYEAYADRLLQRQQFELANRFFQMASFDHPKILNKYICIGAYRESIDYVGSLLSEENDFRKILGENERLELAKMAFECLLAKLIVERSKLLVYRTKLKQTSFEELSNHQASHSQPASPIGARASQQNLFRLCEHSPRGQDAKLSATTIVGDPHADDEETLTSNTDGGESSSPSRAHRLECERSLVDFIRNLMPASLYGYAIDRLLDFDLVELVEAIAQTDTQILALIKALIRSRDEGERLLFRTGKFDSLTNRLERLNKLDLIRINTGKLEFLEFLTSLDVTQALVKDISLTCDFYRYQHTLVQFRKYSFAALRHLETYKLMIDQQRERENNRDENANDGVSPANARMFTQQQKRTAEGIFVEFLIACLGESAEDSCRLWFNYINFYLNYIGDLQSLEADILRLVETSGDCRLAISLYKAIYRGEAARGKIDSVSSARRPTTNGSGTGNYRDSNGNTMDRRLENMSPFFKANLIDNTPLEAMRELHSLANLFANEFLLRLLERTLDLLPYSADLDALIGTTIATMC